jgi:hypothetical protein
MRSTLCGIVVALGFTGCFAESIGADPILSGPVASPGAPGGPTGATVGGTKDIAQFRAEVTAGEVPPSSDLSAEGLLAEHDFPIEGDACADRFCARPAIARHLLRSSGKQEIFVNVGLASNLGANWQRPPADIVVALDKSESMSIDIAETTKGIALMIDRLRDDDRFGMVVFDDQARTLVPLAPIADRAALETTIQSVQASGGFTGVADGANTAFTALTTAQQDGRLSRVMLFACGLPPTPGPFADAVTSNADQGRATSFFGVLLGQDATTVDYYASFHGGNAFFLDDFTQLTTVFDTDLDLIITPLAYDYSMAIQSAGATVTRVWGIPDGSQQLTATTLFPSRNKGAIVLQLSAPDDADLSSLTSLTFSYREKLGGDLIDGASATALETNGGVRKAAAVVNLYDGLVQSLDDYVSKPDLAKSELNDLRAWFSGEAEALNDDQLRADVGLVDALLKNMH